VPWKLTVRTGPRVQRASFVTMQEALDELAQRADELAERAAGRSSPVNARVRRFEPVQQVFARLEVAGPQRLLPSVRGGLDVRGDGSVEAYLGRVRRRLVEQRRRETPLQALRRELDRSADTAGPQKRGTRRA